MGTAGSRQPTKTQQLSRVKTGKRIEGEKNYEWKLNRFESRKAEIAKHGCGQVTTAFPALQFVGLLQTIEHLDGRAQQNGPTRLPSASRQRMVDWHKNRAKQRERMHN